MIKIELNLTNKWLYTLITISIITIIGISGWAYQTTIPSPGHGGNAVLITLNDGTETTLQDAINQNKIGSSDGLVKGEGNFCVVKQKGFLCPNFAPHPYDCDLGVNCPFSSARGGSKGHSRWAIWCCSEIDGNLNLADQSNSKW